MFVSNVPVAKEFTAEELIKLIKKIFGKVATNGYPTITLKPLERNGKMFTLVAVSTMLELKELGPACLGKDGLRRYTLFISELPETVEIRILNSFPGIETFNIGSLVKITKSRRRP